MPEMSEEKKTYPEPDTSPARSDASARTPGDTRKRRPSRRARTAVDCAGTARYFLGKPSNGNGTPDLGEEVASEARALLAAYKSDRHVFLITEYEVTEVISEDKVGLAKQPVAAVPRVSHVNRS